MERKGIDISHHQGDIDFDKLKGSIDFAMVRTSYGDFYKDRKYKQNIEGLEKIGVPYGLYHFSYATDVAGAKKEVEGFLNLIKDYKPLYPVVVDMESFETREPISNDTLVEIANTFCSAIEKNGYYAMIYANLDYLNNKLNNNSLNKYDKWLAQWSSKPTYDKEFGIWQYSSSGSKPGINGRVDLDISYKDYPAIIKKNGLNNTGDNTSNPEVPKPENLIYVVKKNDNLTNIASKYGTTYQTLAKYNGIKNPSLIYPGQIIKIPKEGELKPNTYVIKSGDTLSGIANKFGMSWKTLYEKNKEKIGDDPNLIYPGQTLIL